jgi:integrase
MRKTISTRTLQSLRPDPLRRAIFDTKVKGLHVVPSTTMPGQGAFWLKYSAKGKQRKAKLGSFPELKLSDARAKALGIHSAVAGGEDPMKDVEGQDRHGFNAAVETYLATYSKANHRERTREEVRRLLGDAKDAWRDRRLDNIRPSDVVALLDECMETRSATQSNRLYSYLSGFFNWAADRHMIEHVPIRRGMKAIKREATRDRWLRDEELRAVWNAAEVFGCPFGPLVQMLILTGQRLRQVAGMRWEEVDRLEEPNPFWRTPGDRMKGKREHELPLSPSAADLLSSIRKLAISEEYVFATHSSDGETMPMNWFSKPKARLDRLSGVADWRLHDLRRTVATNLEHMRIERITISTILAHRIPGVPEIYTCADRRDRMRIALENWSARVEELTGGGQNSSNVITMAAQQ